MSNVVRRRIVVGCLATVLIGVLLRLASGGPTALTTEAGAGGPDAAVAETADWFSIEGNTTEPISPGVRASLDLELTNPHESPMTVTDLSVKVLKVSAPHADAEHPCAVGDFVVSQASSSRTITLAARARRTLSSLGLAVATWPHVGMLNSPVNQDGCKGASLTLGYTASGTLGN